MSRTSTRAPITEAWPDQQEPSTITQDTRNYSQFLHRLARIRTHQERAAACQKYIADTSNLALAQLLDLTKFFNLNEQAGPEAPRAEDYEVRIIRDNPYILPKRRLVSRLFSRNKVSPTLESESPELQNAAKATDIKNFIHFLSDNHYEQQENQQNAIKILQDFYEARWGGETSVQQIQKDLKVIFAVEAEHLAASSLAMTAFAETLNRPENNKIRKAFSSLSLRTHDSIFFTIYRVANNIKDLDALTKFATTAFTSITWTADDLNSILSSHGESRKRSCLAKAFLTQYPQNNMENFLKILRYVDKDERLSFVQAFQFEQNMGVSAHDAFVSVSSILNRYRYVDQLDRATKAQLAQKFFESRKQISLQNFCDGLKQDTYLTKLDLAKGFFKARPKISFKELTQALIGKENIIEGHPERGYIGLSLLESFVEARSNIDLQDITLEEFESILSFVSARGPLGQNISLQFLKTYSQKLPLKVFFKIAANLDRTQILELWESQSKEDLRHLTDEDFFAITSLIQDQEIKTQFAQRFIDAQLQSGFLNITSPDNFLRIVTQHVDHERQSLLAKAFIKAKHGALPSPQSDNDIFASLFDGSKSMSESILILIGYGQLVEKQNIDHRALHDLIVELLSSFRDISDDSMAEFSALAPIIRTLLESNDVIIQHALLLIGQQAGLEIKKFKELIAPLNNDEKLELYRSYFKANNRLTIAQVDELIAEFDDAEKAKIHRIYLEEWSINPIAYQAHLIRCLDLLGTLRPSEIFAAGISEYGAPHSDKVFASINNYIRSLNSHSGYDNLKDIFNKLAAIVSTPSAETAEIPHYEKWRLFVHSSKGEVFRKILDSSLANEGDLWGLVPFLTPDDISLALQHSLLGAQTEDQVLALVKSIYANRSQNENLARVLNQLDGAIAVIVSRAGGDLDSFIKLLQRIEEQSGGELRTLPATCSRVYERNSALIQARAKKEADLLAMIPIFPQLYTEEDGRSVTSDYIKKHKEPSATKVLLCHLNNLNNLNILNRHNWPKLEIVTFFQKYKLTPQQLKERILQHITSDETRQLVIKHFALSKMAKHDIPLVQLGEMLTEIGALGETVYRVMRESDYIKHYQKKHAPIRFLHSAKKLLDAKKEFLISLGQSGLVNEKRLVDGNRNHSEFFRHFVGSNLKLDHIFEIGEKIYADNVFRIALMKRYITTIPQNQKITPSEYSALRTFLSSIDPFEALDLIKATNGKKLLDAEQRLDCIKDNFQRCYSLLACFNDKTTDEIFTPSFERQAAIDKIKKTAELPKDKQLTPIEIFALCYFHNTDATIPLTPHLTEESKQLFYDRLTNGAVLLSKEQNNLYASFGLHNPQIRIMPQYLKERALPIPKVDESFSLSTDAAINDGFKERLTNASLKGVSHLEEATLLSVDDAFDVQKTVAFFAKLFAQEDLVAVTNLEQQVRIHNLFVKHKDSFAYFLSQPGGIEIMKHQIFPTAADGCVFNIGAQFQLALNSRLFKKQCDQVLYAIFERQVFTKIMGRNVDHKESIFDHEIFKIGYLSIAGLIGAVRETFITEQLATAEINVFDFLAKEFMSDEEKALPLTSAEYQKAIERNKVFLLATLKKQAPIGKYEDEITIMQRAVSVATGLVLEDFSKKFTQVELNHPSAAAITVGIEDRKKTAELFLKRRALQEEFAAALKSCDDDHSAIQDFFEKNNLSLDEIKLFCYASPENFELFVKHLEEVATKWVARNEDECYKTNSFQIEVIAEYMAMLAKQDEIDPSGQKLRGFYLQHAEIFAKCEKGLGSILKTEIDRSFPIDSATTETKATSQSLRDRKFREIDNMLEGIKSGDSDARFDDGADKLEPQGGLEKPTSKPVAGIEHNATSL